GAALRHPFLRRCAARGPADPRRRRRGRPGRVARPGRGPRDGRPGRDLPDASHVPRAQRPGPPRQRGVGARRETRDRHRGAQDRGGRRRVPGGAGMSGLHIPLGTPDGSRTDHAENLLAPNPSPMTLDGTNTWVIGEREAVVVDPGPDDEAHLLRVRDHLGERRVTEILLTHGHPDHSGGARRFAELVGAPVRALDPRHRLGEEGLADGDVVTVDGLEIHVYGTPGHTFDSLCFWLPQDRAILTGDTVLGRGTTIIAEDGDLGDYLRSLDRLRAAAESLEAR